MRDGAWGVLLTQGLWYAHAQDRRRQKATIRDNRVGNVLEDTRTLADLKLVSGDCLMIRRKPGAFPLTFSGRVLIFLGVASAICVPLRVFLMV